MRCRSAEAFQHRTNKKISVVREEAGMQLHTFNESKDVCRIQKEQYQVLLALHLTEYWQKASDGSLWTASFTCSW